MSNITQQQIDNYIEYQISNISCKEDVRRLIRLKSSILQRQFVDSSENLSQEEYNKWLKQAKKTYLLSLETKSILMGDLHYYPIHSSEELNTGVVGNLTPIQIINILDSLDLYTIMKLITENVTIYSVENEFAFSSFGHTTLIGFSEGNSIIAYPFHPFNRSVSTRDGYCAKRDGIKSINGKNAYEVLYGFLRLPIKTVLASINEVNTHFPCNLSFDEGLCTRIEQIQKETSTPQLLLNRRK